MRKTNRIKTSAGRKVFVVINYTILTILMLSCILPFVYMVAISFSQRTYVEAGLVTLWPKGFNTLSYRYLINKAAFWKAFLVSIYRTVLGTAINLFLICLTAYPLSMGNDKLHGRTVYTWMFFITMLISGGLIPHYVLVCDLGLRDTIWALVLPGALSIYNLVLMINFFRQVPEEMQEAALIDGAGHFRILFQIFIPLSKASIATISLFCMVGHWNAWFDGVLYITTPEKLPLQTYLRNLVMKMDITQITGDDYALLQLLSNQSLKATQIIIAIIPILLVYPFLQKYFVKGMTLGGVKG